MLVKVGSNPTLNVPLDIPNLTAGVPSWGTSDNYIVLLNGIQTPGLGGNTTSGPSAAGPGNCVVSCNIGDFPSVGYGGIFVLDVGGNIVGWLPITVVSFDPLT